MGFGDNLRAVRRERNISQEELAGLLNVSRQAISKWEQNNGYPEMEKMIQLSEVLDISLDFLVSDYKGGKNVEKNVEKHIPSGRLTIKNPDGKFILNCYKVLSHRVSPFKKATDIPQYALFGIDSSSFWGENKTLLGWYVDADSIQREVDDITKAMEDGIASYELKYAAKVKESFLSVKLIEKSK